MKIFEVILKRQLRRSADVAKVISTLLVGRSVLRSALTRSQLVDCVWRILRDDPRSRNAMIREIELYQTQRSLTSRSEKAPTLDIPTLHDPVPPLQSSTKRDLVVSSDDTDLSLHISPVELQFHSRTNVSAKHKYCSSSGESVNEEESKKDVAPVDTGSGTYHRVSKDETCENECSQAGESSISTESAQQKLHDPELKKQGTAPDFNNPKFATIKQPLRRQIYTCRGLDCLRDCWIMLDAFRSHTIEQVQCTPLEPRIRQLKYRMKSCDALEKKNCALDVKAHIGRRFCLVQLIAEYYKKKGEAEMNNNSSSVDEEFKRELFPHKNSKQAESSWNYCRREGEVLLAAVHRFGYGVLVFPLRKATRRR